MIELLEEENRLFSKMRAFFLMRPPVAEVVDNNEFKPWLIVVIVVGIKLYVFKFEVIIYSMM